MRIIKGYYSIKFGETIHPEKGLPYVKIILSESDEIIDAGSVIWDMGLGQWEIRTREEAEEMLREMEKERER